jgi:tRNA threonylcarbamoyladenosine biosynthesis protein TsaB
MIVLAFDTALAACSAALYDSACGEVLASRRRLLPHGHAEVLPGMIADVAREAGVPLAAVERIAVTRGPGTFTGVRIGLATARGLALALARPAVALSTLEALACNFASPPDAAPVTAVIDARRGEVYLGLFDGGGAALDDPALLTVGEAARRVPAGAWLLGSGAPLLLAAGCPARPAPAGEWPDAASFVARAAALAPGAPPDPLYLRAADAKPQAPAVAAAKAALAVRPAAAADAQVMAALHAACFSEPWSAPDFAALVTAPGGVARLAFLGEGAPQPVGFALARHAAGEAEILTLCTRPATRRRGVARALVRSLVEALGAEGVTSLFLEVGEDNQPALALYQSLGFEVVGRRAGYYWGTVAGRGNALVMCRGL